ncbi:MAG: OsmC family protein [Verrucomicrobiota bacterium]|nr:OsmC family protein [Verrucomicrobiota bacterium]
MVKMSIRYTGGLHCAATHGPSQTEIATDAPTDNQGKGEAFSPTDLVAAALGTCMATTMAIVGERKGIKLDGMTVEVTKEMTDNPRRIRRIGVEIHLPLPESCSDRELLERTARHCPVHQSLHPDVQMPVQFFWEG